MPEHHTKYHLSIEDDEGEPIEVDEDGRPEPKIFEDLNAARQYAIESKSGKVFIIFEDKPLIWAVGDHLRGERNPNGTIDWVRVPLFQNI